MVLFRHLGQRTLDNIVVTIGTKTNNEAELERVRYWIGSHILMYFSNHVCLPQLEYLLESLGRALSLGVANAARAAAARNLAWPTTREGFIVTGFLENYNRG